MTIIEAEGQILEVNSPEEVGREIGANILSLLNEGQTTERPYYFLTTDEAQSLMHKAFLEHVSIDPLADPQSPRTVKTIESSRLVRDEIMGVDLHGNECVAGWQYSVEASC